MELVDLAPTILEFCGLEVPDSIQGMDLWNVLEGAAGDHREQVFVEYSENEEAMVLSTQSKNVRFPAN